VKEFTTDNIRNICLAGQRGCGKTSLADAIAYSAGVNSRIGRVDDGSSLFDYTEEELSRKSSLSSKLMACTWQDKKINLFDCPGHADFIGEFLSASHVCDAVGVVIDAGSGVEVGTQLQWKSLPEKGMARFFFVNKMENAFGKQAVAVQLPIGEGVTFSGIIDLLHMKAYKFAGDDRTEIDIPEDLKAEAEAQRESLIEAAAESNDALMEKFFDEGTLNAERRYSERRRFHDRTSWWHRWRQSLSGAIWSRWQEYRHKSVT